MQKQRHTKNTYRFFCALSLSLFTPQTPAFPSTTTCTLSGATLASVYIGYRYLLIPNYNEPTLEILQPVSALPLDDSNTLDNPNPFIVKTATVPYRLQSGTEACVTQCAEPLWLLASGWKTLFDQMTNSRIESSYVGLRRYLKRNIFHGPSIAFIYQDDRRAFNFGQDLDQKTLNTLYEKTGNRELILYGLCRGALTILGWLENFENNNTIKAVILESPALSLKDICLEVGKNSLNMTQGRLLHFLFKNYFPNYDSNNTSTLNALEKLHVTPETPFFIGHIKGDNITTDEKVSLLVKTLRATRTNPIYFFVCDEALDHGKLSRSQAYQQTVNAFLKKYDLPHDASLAEQGEESLLQAHEKLSVI